jgi:hypothetical protein
MREELVVGLWVIRTRFRGKEVAGLILAAPILTSKQLRKNFTEGRVGNYEAQLVHFGKALKGIMLLLTKIALSPKILPIYIFQQRHILIS